MDVAERDGDDARPEFLTRPKWDQHPEKGGMLQPASAVLLPSSLRASQSPLGRFIRISIAYRPFGLFIESFFQVKSCCWRNRGLLQKLQLKCKQLDFIDNFGLPALYPTNTVSDLGRCISKSMNCPSPWTPMLLRVIPCIIHPPNRRPSRANPFSSAALTHLHSSLRLLLPLSQLKYLYVLEACTEDFMIGARNSGLYLSMKILPETCLYAWRITSISPNSGPKYFSQMRR